ncbi:MAG TPA: hypothetical protein VIL97_10360 [Thermoanaerobaculia bacterium]
MNAPKEVLGEGHLKGVIFRSHLAWAREHLTPAELEQLWQRVGPEISDALSGPIVVSSWYPFAWLITLDRALIDLHGSHYPDLARELGRYSARINLTTTYRAFDRQSNHEFFRNSALLHSQFQDFGQSTYEQLGDDAGRIRLTNYNSFSPIYCKTALGYYEQAIQNHGAARVDVKETECQCYGDKSCTFELKWE